MAHQRRQLEQLREELPNNPMKLLTADQDLSAPTKGLPSMLCKDSCMLLMGRDMLGGSCTCIPLLRRLGMFLGAVLVPLCMNFRCELAASSPEGAQWSSLSQGSTRRGEKRQEGRGRWVKACLHCEVGEDNVAGTCRQQKKGMLCCLRLQFL